MHLHPPERTRLGLQTFVRRAAGVAVVPVLDGAPVTTVDGTAVVSRCEGDTCYLILDYREQPASEPAYVEWWPVESGVEGALAGLLVLTDSYLPPTVCIVPFSCAALVTALLHTEAPSPWGP